ncbi:MAG: Nif3-like dinuclear metal center hexameric protein [Flavisolibacter sp.]
MKIGEILQAIEENAPLQLQEPYDNAGLITGQSLWTCTGVICTLDVTMEVMKEAIDKGCNLIVAHHPVIFKGLKKITGDNYVQKIIIEALKNDIALYAAHTNLDNTLEGVNGMMASKLKLLNCVVLIPKTGVLKKLITFAPLEKAEEVVKGLFRAGAGQMGHYNSVNFTSQGIGTFQAGPGAHPYVGEIGKLHQEKETKIEVVYPFFLEQKILEALVFSHPYEKPAFDILSMSNVEVGMGAGLIGELATPMSEMELLLLIKKEFCVPSLKYTTLCHKPVKKIALCGGTGSFLIPAALKAEADLFFTADIKYHEFFDAEGKMVLADIGHYESEHFTTDLIYNHLAQKFPTFAVLKTGINTNPVHYLF